MRNPGYQPEFEFTCCGALASLPSMRHPMLTCPAVPGTCLHATVVFAHAGITTPHAACLCREGVSRRCLSWYTWHLWYSHYIELLGRPPDGTPLLPLSGEQPLDYTVPVTDAPQADWRAMMQVRDDVQKCGGV